jgi:hypothetical protein
MPAGAVLSDLWASRRGPKKRKGQTMRTKTMKNSMALGACGVLGLAGVLVIATANSLWAAPALLNTAAVRTAALNQVTNVQYYDHGYHRNGYRRHGYYGRGYYRRAPAAPYAAPSTAPYTAPQYYGSPGY